MATAVYPGSFDPITLGHIDIIRRVSPLFESLTVLVANSTQKNYLFTGEERKSLIEKSLDGLPNVKVDVYQGLTVDYLRKHKQRVIIRGIRAVSDFESELVMANMNKSLAPDLETMVVFASPKYHYVASRVIKEVVLHGGDLSGYVPEPVMKALKAKLRQPAKLQKPENSQKNAPTKRKK